MRRVVLSVVALALAGCGGGSDDGFAPKAAGSGSTTDTAAVSESTTTTEYLALSEAFCNDLEAGLSPFQILNPAVEDGTYTAEEAADRAYGFAAIDCPEQLQTNEALRFYLENWNIDPDA